VSPRRGQRRKPYTLVFRDGSYRSVDGRFVAIHEMPGRLWRVRDTRVGTEQVVTSAAAARAWCRRQAGVS